MLRKIIVGLIPGIIVGGILALVTAGILIGTEVTRVNGWITIFGCGMSGNGMWLRAAGDNTDFFAEQFGARHRPGARGKRGRSGNCLRPGKADTALPAKPKVKDKII